MMPVIDPGVEHYDSAAWLEMGLRFCPTHPTRLIATRTERRQCDPCKELERRRVKGATT